MCPDRGRDTRPTSPRTRTKPNSPSIMRLTAPDSSETENSGAFSPGVGSSIKSDISAPCNAFIPILEPLQHKAKRGCGHEYPDLGRRRARTRTGMGGDAEPQMRQADRGT